MPKTYYDVLGVAVQASQDTIKSAFRRKAQIIHPDKIQSQTAGLDPYAAQRLKEALEQDFRELKEAYDVLTDRHKKKEYDELLQQIRPDFASPAGNSRQGASGAWTSQSQPHSQPPPAPNYCPKCGSPLIGMACAVCAKRQTSAMWKMGSALRRTRIYFSQNTTVILAWCLFVGFGLPLAVALPKWASWDANLCGAILSIMSILGLIMLLSIRPLAKWAFKRHPTVSLFAIGSGILAVVAVSVGATNTAKSSARAVDANHLHDAWRTNKYYDTALDRYASRRSSQDTLSTEDALLECKDHPTWSMWPADGSSGLLCPDFIAKFGWKDVTTHAESLPIPKAAEVAAPLAKSTEVKASPKSTQQIDVAPTPTEPDPLPFYGTAGGCGSGSFMYGNAELTGGPVALVNNGQVLRLGTRSGVSYPAQIYDFKTEEVTRSGFIAITCITKVWTPEGRSSETTSTAAAAVTAISTQPVPITTTRDPAPVPASATASAQSGRPSLAGLSVPEAQSIEAACSHAKYLEGPSAYDACLRDQLTRLGTTRRPDISALSLSEQQSIESACSHAKYLEGPSAYDACLANQLGHLGTTRRPDISSLSTSEQQSIESVCSNAKYLQGPAAYDQCLRSQLGQLGTIRRPDISSLSVSEQQSIESACSRAKYLEGPARYDECLATQLRLLRGP